LTHLRKHEWHMHKSKRPFICEKCNITFLSATSLSNHRRIHSTGRCEQVDKMSVIHNHCSTFVDSDRDQFVIR